MRDTYLIARREVFDTVRTRAFWLGVLLFPVIWTVMLKVPGYLAEKSMQTRAFALWNPGGEFAAVVTNAFERSRLEAERQSLAAYAARYAPGAAAVTVEELQTRGGWQGALRRLAPSMASNAPAFRPPPPRFVQVPLPAGASAPGMAGVAEALKPWLRGENKVELDGRPAELFAAVLIPPGFGEVRLAGSAASPAAPAFQFWAANVADDALQHAVEEALSAELRRRSFEARGMDPAVAREIEAVRAPMTVLDPRKEAGKAEVGLGDRVKPWAPSVAVYVLWVAVFTVGQMLMNSVIEEKSSRVVELLLASVSPASLMAGKLFGIGLIGLLMLGSWFVTAAAGAWWASSHSAAAAATAAGGPGGDAVAQIIGALDLGTLLPGMMLYFLLGYLVYGAFFLAIGSACNSAKEVQAMMAAVMPILLVPLVTLMIIPRDPNGTLAVVLSWIPPFTPFTMLNRLSAHPPWRDVIGTSCLLVAFIGLEIWAAGRIFQRALLRTGDAPTWRDIWRLLRRE